ncbi:hypothetical protein KUV89_01675 [Marinobacter hydrocarbonoclasticus]|nr:hypothetical protein [Marinobacter nauticus]
MFRPSSASVMAALLISVGAVADDVGPEIFESGSESPASDTVVIPIVGAMESTGLIGGTVAAITGVGQPGAQLVGFGAYSVNDSYIAFMGYYNLSIFGRWTLDISGLQAEFMDSTFYPDSLAAGGLSSSLGEPLEASYLQQDAYLTLRYPISFDEDAASRQQYLNGLPIQPQSIAKTTVEIEPFYRAREVRAHQAANIEGKTYGVSLILDRDTRDFWPSPSRGYHAYSKLDRDWGNQERAAYSRWEAQYTHYLDLGGQSWSRQQTLALTGYLSDIPTWRTDDANRQPDWFAQSVLGGSERLRGYGDDRFTDRSALYYGAEYRAIPNWQPQNRIPFFNRYDFPWWQIALFAEVGKTANRFDFSELHRSMEWSAGFGLRFYIERMIARADFGFSNENSLFHFTVNQPF